MITLHTISKQIDDLEAACSIILGKLYLYQPVTWYMCADTCSALPYESMVTLRYDTFYQSHVSH